MSECREGHDGFFATQSLRVQQGEHEAVTVFEVPTVGPLPVFFRLCRIFGEVGMGAASVFAGAFQRLGVTPDGSGVVFEVTDDFSINAPDLLVPPEQEGIYYVRADGGGLRRLGPASRDANFGITLDRTSPTGFRGSSFPSFSFSRRGDRIAFVDVGGGPAGEEALQIFTESVMTGERTQLTHLPFAPPKGPLDNVVGAPFFFGDRAIGFASDANPNELNPQGNRTLFLINADGSELRLSASFADVSLPSGQVQPRFGITGSGQVAGTIQVPGSQSGANQEVFIEDGKNLLQLTSFERADTGNTGLFTSVDGQRVIFTASSDRFANPNFDCQLFSVDILGADVRQLTHFSTEVPSVRQCGAFPGPGCLLEADGNGFAPSQDARNGTIILGSSCDGAGNSLNSVQLFAMNADGAALRQLTHTRGMTTEANGTVDVELPGPYAYGPYE